MLKNLLFLATAKRAAAKRAEALLRRAMQNPQFSEHGAFRARIDFNLGSSSRRGDGRSLPWPISGMAATLR